MSVTPSNMLPLGTKAPAFVLPDTISGTEKSLDELCSSKATVIMFICNHCPFVVHILDQLIQLGKDYQKQGISFVAISSNDVTTHPGDSPDKMKSLALEKEFPFPYLYDENQEVAQSYHAACTPDFYIFDEKKDCVYRGQLDDARPGNDIPVTGKDIRAALDALLNGHPVSERQRPSSGCNIKWKENR